MQSNDRPYFHDATLFVSSRRKSCWVNWSSPIQAQAKVWFSHRQPSGVRMGSGHRLSRKKSTGKLPFRFSLLIPRQWQILDPEGAPCVVTNGFALPDTNIPEPIEEFLDNDADFTLGEMNAKAIVGAGTERDVT